MVLPFEILPIEDDGVHILVVGEINGKPARLLVDTGASRTVFDRSRVMDFVPENHGMRKLDKLSAGLGTNSMEGQALVLQEFQLGETRLSNYHAVALDLTHINQSYEMLGHPMIDGVLGGDLLNDLKMTIDFRKRQLRWR